MFRSLRRSCLAAAILGLGAATANAQLVRSSLTTTTASTSLTTSSTSTLEAATTSTTTQKLEPALEWTPTVAPPCDEAMLDEIFETAGPDTGTSVTVNCSFSMDPLRNRVRITKRLVFTGNTQGVTVDCLGYKIDGGPGSYLYDNGDRGVNIVEIVSSLIDGPTLRWSAHPQDITIRDCEIVGSARIWPFNFWEEANMEKQAALSRQPGYVATLRANAPRNIRFEQVTFRAQKHTPLYIGPGVTGTVVSDSWFLGGAQGVILYLDAESSRNVIRGNQFHAESDLGDKPREILAIDGSDHNQIVGNYFSALDHGGIYLYRNCGEGLREREIGVVRFTTPSHNQIINNVFYYAEYDGRSSYYDSNDFAPAVFLGSRNNDRPYCPDDSDFAGGSGSDNRSFATHNVVMQNRFFKRSVEDSVVTKWFDVNVPNYVAYNEGGVLTAPDRPSGCFVDSAYGQFLRDGETTRLLRSSTGAPICSATRTRCANGTLVDDATLAVTSCQIDRVPFSCPASGNDAGCARSAICPSGTTLVRTVAACNLEYGTVASTQVDAIRGNGLRVVRPSDDVDDGNCYAGSASISSGEAVIERPAGRVYFGCSEHDENGGDCHVLGELFCQNERLVTSGSLTTGTLLSVSGTR